MEKLVEEISFTKEVKNEIALISDRKQSESLALLSSFIKINGNLILRNNEWIIDIHSENQKIAKLIFTLVKSIFNADCQVKVSEKKHFKKVGNSTVVNIEISKGVKEMLKTLRVYDDINGFKTLPSKEYLKDVDNKRAYLAGCFLASGSVNSPKTSNYHLEVAVNSEDHALYIIKLLKNFDIEAKSLTRRNQIIVYLKKSEQIADFLRVIGSNQGLLKFENVRIQRDQINSMNRVTNCDLANLDKTVSNGLEQQKKIRLLEEKIGINNLDTKYIEIARIRLEHPEYSLNDIADELREEHHINITKSGVYHRLEKIMEIVDKLVVNSNGK